MNVSWNAPDIETSSAGYAQRFSGKAGEYMLATQTRAVLRALRGCRPGRVLDVGGGHGQLVDPLRELGWSVTVTGSSLECERNLRDLHRKHSCTFVRADILDLPFPDGSFDLVTSVRLISHVDDWQRLLAELCRVTSKWALIDYPSTLGLNALTPLFFSVKKGLEGNTRTYRSFSRNQLAKAFALHGFRPKVAVKQFVLPMALHRAMGSAAPLRLAESLSRATGVTALVGSPVILRVDRTVAATRNRKLRILLVAPQPFYQERGTPIAVRLLVETLCRAGHKVDLLTYHEGIDVEMPGLRIERASRIPGVSHIPIGISWKKLACDVSLSIRLARLMARGQYDVIHAVEESIFPAAFFNLFARKRLVYDMDSILSDQLMRKWRLLAPLAALLRRLERLAIRRADWVFPVCEDLAKRAREHVPAERVVILPDTPLPAPDHTPAVEDLRVLVDSGHLIALYVGNLERYQGIDLMLEAIARLGVDTPIDLVIIGGDATQIEKHAAKASAYGVAERVHFLGPKPLECLSSYLDQADILVSPRAWGSNTPLKVYSYMKTGKAILATRIRAHTQVLDDECAILCDPNAEALAHGLAVLFKNRETCLRLGWAARARVESEYSPETFRRKLLATYERMSVTNA